MEIIKIREDLSKTLQPIKSDIYRSLKLVQRAIRSENNIAKSYLLNLISEFRKNTLIIIVPSL